MTKGVFRDLYKECLKEAVEKYPELYLKMDEDAVNSTVQKIMDAMEPGSVNIRGSKAFQIMAKRLGIPFTVKAVMSFYRRLEK